MLLCLCCVLVWVQPHKERPWRRYDQDAACTATRWVPASAAPLHLLNSSGTCYRLDVELGRLEFEVHPYMALEQQLVRCWVQLCVTCMVNSGLTPAHAQDCGQADFVAFALPQQTWLSSILSNASTHVAATWECCLSPRPLQAAQLLCSFRQYHRRASFGLSAFYGQQLAAFEDALLNAREALFSAQQDADQQADEEQLLKVGEKHKKR